MIIDIHGHFTTGPAEIEDWRRRQLAAGAAGEALPDPTSIAVSDDDLREAVGSNQVARMDERGIDVTLISPRASRMGHHLGDGATSRDWARVCNHLISRIRDLFPGRFHAVAMLPQSPGVGLDESLAEIDRAHAEGGIVGVNVNPDPSGGHWTEPGLGEKYWYPLWEKLCDLQLPAMVHVSASAIPSVHAEGAFYLHADTTAFLQLASAPQVFTDFPDLKIVVPHGGGAVPYHWGRFRGLIQAQGGASLEERVFGNVFFDTCVYEPAGLAHLVRTIPTSSILFASETFGAVRGIDPVTGRAFDETLTVLRGLDLPEEDFAAITELNAKSVYPRIA